MTPDIAYGYLFRVILIFMAVYIAFGVYRSVVSREVCDRVMSTNMTGSAVISCLLVLTALLGESYLPDIAMIYVLVNFTQTVILSKIYIKRKNGTGGKIK